MADTAYRTIQDYMSAMSDTAKHQRILVSNELKRGIEKVNQIDFLNLELSTMSAAERDLFSALEMEENWVCEQKGNVLNFNVTTIADSDGHRQLRQTTPISLDFNANGRFWTLSPMSGYAHEQDRLTGGMAYDTVMKARLNTVFANVSTNVMSGLFMQGAASNMNLKPDMRHIFQKLYLMLCDYNLFVTMGGDEIEQDPRMQFDTHNDVTPMHRMNIIANYDVVVDAEGMTPEELGVLVLGGMAYPSVRYSGDNVYNCIEMPKDSVAVVSERKVDLSTDIVWGSPSRLYHIICSLACKMGCVDDMLDAFSKMRGMPFQVLPMVNENGSNNVEIANYVPLSVSYSRATGEVVGLWDVLAREGGYYSWSKALVAEAMLGEMYRAVASNLVEEIGGFGGIFGSSTPEQSKVLNGFLRDHGLNHGDNSINSLIYNWGKIAGHELQWGYFLTVKEYIVKLCGMAKGSWDIPVPQIQLFNVVNTYKNTAWGLMRNWEGGPSSPYAKKDEKIRKIENAMCFGWAMGIRAKRPMVHANKKGDRMVYLTPDEQEFLVAQNNQTFKINSIGITLSGARSGRIDEYDEVTRDFIVTHTVKAGEFIVFNHDSGWGRPEPKNRSDFIDQDRLRRTVLDQREDVSEATVDDGAEELYDVNEASIEYADLENSVPTILSGDDEMPKPPSTPAMPMTGRKDETGLLRSKPGKPGQFFRLDEDGNRTAPLHTKDGRASNRPVSPEYNDSMVGVEHIDIQVIDNKYEQGGAFPAIVQCMAIKGMVEADEIDRAGKMCERMVSQRISSNAEISALGDQFNLSINLLEPSGAKNEFDVTVLGRSGGESITVVRDKGAHKCGFVKPGNTYSCRVTNLVDAEDLIESGKVGLNSKRLSRQAVIKKPARMFGLADMK